MRRIFSYLFFFLVPHLLLCEKLPLKIYTTADGLASSAVSSVLCDSRGFVWFSTRNGISRFDGERFVTYGQEDGLTDVAVFSIQEMHDGTYWVALNNGTSCRFRPDQHQFSAGRSSAKTRPMFEPLSVVVDSESYSLARLQKDSFGELYIGGKGSFLHFDRTLGWFRRIVLPPQYNDDVISITRDQTGTIWLGTSSGVLRYLKSGMYIHYSLNPIPLLDWVTDICIDRSGRLWIAHSRSGIFVVRPEQVDNVGASKEGAWSFQPIVIEESSRELYNLALSSETGTGTQILMKSPDEITAATDIIQTVDGRVWIGTNSNALLVVEGHRLKSVTVEDGFPDCKPYAFSEDLYGNLWIATSNGVIKVALTGMRQFDLSDGLADLAVHSLYEDQHHNLIAVSGLWYLNYYDGRRYSSFRPRIPPDVSYAWASNIAYLDKQNAWWFLTDHGLWLYEQNLTPVQIPGRMPKKILRKADGLLADEIYRAYEDKAGNLWLSFKHGSNEGYGLVRWKRNTETIEVCGRGDGLPPFLSPSAFCEDSNGNVWMGLYQGGITRYRNGRFRYYSPAEGVPERMITSLLIDRQGRMWIGSNQDGLARVDNPSEEILRFHRYTTKDGLGSNNVRALVDDQWGRLYIGTVRGIDRLDPKTETIKHYTLSDGLSGEFITCSLRDHENNLWFGTTQGLSRMEPEPPGFESKSPSIFISGLHVAGIPLPLSPLGESSVAGLELLPDQTNVQIEFFSVGRGIGEVIRYQYKLKGAQEGWSVPVSERTVHFANLAPGNYEFQVRAINAEGICSLTPARVTFIIYPPVTMRWWFRASMGLIIVGLIYGMYRYKVANLLRIERLRLQIASDLHDDVGAALTKIAIHSEIIKNTKDVNKTYTSSQIIGNLSREIIKTFSDIIWSLDVRHDSYGELIARVKSFALDVLSPLDISFELSVDGIDFNEKLSVNFRQNLYLIVKEALNNIVKHSNATNVVLTLQKKNNMLSLEVKDNGQGLNHREATSGHGLQNMKMRAERLGGLLSFQSEEGFLLCLKINLP